nr:1-phosphofructokinase family hexose kinase [Maliibacterium massiliense]
MITTVCPNPSIDRELRVKGLEVGGTNRVINTVDMPGGKGINVATTLAALGSDVTCIGLMPTHGTTLMIEDLAARNIRTDFVRYEGNLRINIKVHDMRYGQVTELNTRGDAVDEALLDALVASAQKHAEESDIIVFSGSLPPEAKTDLYARMVRACRDKARCVVDAGGEMLQLAVAERPFLIKPNKSELEMTVGARLIGRRDVARAARALIEKGAQIVVVSLGQDGAMLVTQKEAYVSNALQVALGSTVGAGDAMVAGMCASLMRGESLEDVLGHGVAAATMQVALHKDRHTHEELYSRAQVERLTI